MRKAFPFFVLSVLLMGCRYTNKEQQVLETKGVVNDSIFTTPLGMAFSLPIASEKAVAAYKAAKEAFEKDPDDVNASIWYGRRTAYLGKYDDAIRIYSEALKKFPEDPRLYRHRAHRYISVRNYDQAIADLEKAGRLIEGKPDEIEPDGIPNALNIPVSTLHSNIWYHLGLAYYLKHNYEKAFEAFQKCRQSGDNDDNLVSSTHWLYMIQRRMANKELADQQLEPISSNATIIENDSYYDLCRLYKGLIPIDSLQLVESGNPTSDAILYGLANWHFYNGEEERAKEMMNTLVEGKAWSSFGYLAAESDLIKYFGQGPK